MEVDELDVECWVSLILDSISDWAQSQVWLSSSVQMLSRVGLSLLEPLLLEWPEIFGRSRPRCVASRHEIFTKLQTSQYCIVVERGCDSSWEGSAELQLIRVSVRLSLVAGFVTGPPAAEIGMSC